MNKKFISDVLDATVVPGFSRVGYLLRAQLGKWSPVSDMNLEGRVVVITGPTSGLGAATARMLAPTGAQLVLVARNQEKCDAFVAELEASFPLCHPVVVIAEMGDLSSVAGAARQIREQFPRIDVLVHNAGALLQERAVSSQGMEQTIASHVVGPHLMTTMLRDVLRAANGRVVTVSSGGMYSTALPQLQQGESLEMPESDYNGTRQYAYAKRAQVTLNELWAHKEPNIEFVAMHPGWADTPGVQESIPLFRTVTKPILRTSEQGADTIAWLAGVRPLPHKSGTFWSDREVRSVHKTPMTRRADTEAARDALWTWCNDAIQPYVG
jgi:NAD(P)-dependent dehydrogenase (short-subunit alcohol dehydrogenase family)